MRFTNCCARCNAEPASIGSFNIANNFAPFALTCTICAESMCAFCEMACNVDARCVVGIEEICRASLLVGSGVIRATGYHNYFNGAGADAGVGAPAGNVSTDPPELPP